jgi:hypothetical protein
VSARARRGIAVAGVVVAVGVVMTFGVLSAQHQDVNFSPAVGPENARLASAESIRGDFWSVARHSFADEPLRGVGSGGFAVAWLRERPILYAARDATPCTWRPAAELGLVGIVAAAARSSAASRASRARPSGGDPASPPDPSPCWPPGRCTPAWTGTGRCRRSRSWRSCSRPLLVARGAAEDPETVAPRAERPGARGRQRAAEVAL